MGKQSLAFGKGRRRRAEVLLYRVRCWGRWTCLHGQVEHWVCLQGPPPPAAVAQTDGLRTIVFPECPHHTRCGFSAGGPANTTRPRCLLAALTPTAPPPCPTKLLLRLPTCPHPQPALGRKQPLPDLLVQPTVSLSENISLSLSWRGTDRWHGLREESHPHPPFGPGHPHTWGFAQCGGRSPMKGPGALIGGQAPGTGPSAS